MAVNGFHTIKEVISVSGLAMRPALFDMTKLVVLEWNR